MKTTQIVVDLGFGDSGKGLVVDSLCDDNTTVVRYSSGPQAGHTVVYENLRHVFSNFGSGTLRGCPTFWSKYCTFDPMGVDAEYTALQAFGVSPILYVDNLAMVITPYDRAYNQYQESGRSIKHGTCGAGHGATMKRNESPVKLYVQDLFNEFVFINKMWAIKDYYYSLVDINSMLGKIFQSNTSSIHDAFMTTVAKLKSETYLSVVSETEFFQSINDNNLVFEGGQGVMLDAEYGIFPHVTYANTTSRNAMEIIQRNNLPEPEVFYVTRSYQTRHGDGPMSNEAQAGLLKLKNNADETNVTNTWQGQFRTSLLDLDSLRYAIACDNNFSYECNKNLVITCMDQIEGDWHVWQNNDVVTVKDELELFDTLFPKESKQTDFNINSLFGSYGPKANDISEILFDGKRLSGNINE